jgi:hypothetical protein
MNGPTPNDALNNPLKLNAKYGYSQQQNGFGTIVVGKLKKIGKQRVTIEVMSRRRFLYGKVCEEFLLEDIAPTVNVQPYHLFPIYEPQHPRQKDLMDAFWFMLQECESRAESGGRNGSRSLDLQHYVECYYRLWNSIMDDNKQPRWIREA